METAVNVLGRNAARIESEFLERLHKVRFGLDRGWRPPGLLMQGGSTEQRARAMERLKELAINDGFFGSHVAIGPDLSLRDTGGICRAALEAAGLAGQVEAGADPYAELRRLAAASRELGRDGWVLLIDPVERFEGTARERAESYRELVRWMGTLPGEPDLGLFCVLAVTSGFQESVARPGVEVDAIRAELQATGSRADLELLDAAEGGIYALEREAMVYELLVLEWTTKNDRLSHKRP